MSARLVEHLLAQPNHQDGFLRRGGKHRASCYFKEQCGDRMSIKIGRSLGKYATNRLQDGHPIEDCTAASYSEISFEVPAPRRKVRGGKMSSEPQISLRISFNQRGKLFPHMARVLHPVEGKA